MNPSIAIDERLISVHRKDYSVAVSGSGQLIVLLATFDGALCAPLLAVAAIAKYHVPAANPVIVWLVTVGSVSAVPLVFKVGTVQLRLALPWAGCTAATVMEKAGNADDENPSLTLITIP